MADFVGATTAKIPVQQWLQEAFSRLLKMCKSSEDFSHWAGSMWHLTEVRIPLDTLF